MGVAPRARPAAALATVGCGAARVHDRTVRGRAARAARHRGHRRRRAARRTGRRRAVRLVVRGRPAEQRRTWSPQSCRAAFANGATHVSLHAERARGRRRVSRLPRHPLVLAVRPVVEALGATMVADRGPRARRPPVAVGGRGDRRGADGAAARRARPADRTRRARARRAAAVARHATTSSGPSGCSTSAARSSCAAPSRTSPTRWASAASPSTTT